MSQEAKQDIVAGCRRAHTAATALHRLPRDFRSSCCFESCCSDFVAYGKGANAARLARIKAKYDPTNFLRESRSQSRVP